MQNAAIISEKCGFDNTSAKTMSIIRSKYKTREVLQKNNLYNKFFKKCKLHEIKEIYLSSPTLPLIFKPTNLAGSIGVFLLDSISAIDTITDYCSKHSLLQNINQEYIIEEFIEGTEISIEGICYQNNFFPFSITDKRTTGSPYYFETGHCMPSVYEKDSYLAPKIYNFIQSCINAVGILNGPIHAEMFVLEKNNFELIEIHNRYGGDRITELLKRSLSFGIFSAFYNQLIGEKHIFNSPKGKKYVSIDFLVNKPGEDKKITRNNNYEKYLEKASAVLTCYDNIGEQCSVQSHDKLGHFICENDNYEKLNKSREYVKKHITFK